LEENSLAGFSRQHWKILLIAIVAVDVLVVGVVFYIFTTPNSQAESAIISSAVTPVIVTSTPWPGPGPRPTATPTVPPTAIPTALLAPGGFPVGFTPTPRPTREPVKITLPQIYFGGKKWTDVPIVNQVHYPESFFPPGTNNACGPVALFAAVQGLGVDASYTHLRNIAVNNGFNAQGISRWGIINTAVTLNSEVGSPLRVEYGDRYNTRDLLNHLQRGGVVMVLVQLQKVGGGYRLTGHTSGTIGHFVLVERINFKTGKVKLAGSTLGMDEVPLLDFLQSWTRNPNLTMPTNWKSYLDAEPATRWALILKRA
jgi:hypothetical protein